MSSIYRIWINDFGSLQQQIKKKEDSILLPVIPRVGDIILYFYELHPEADDTEDIYLKVTSVTIFCQPSFDKLNIKLGQESTFWDEAFDYHAEITVDKSD
jgi:hypothetical protein